MNKLVTDVNMGTNLRNLRKQNNYTQDQVVALLAHWGVTTTRSLYSRLETGELNIPISVLIALRTIYHCSYEDFFQGLQIQKDTEA